MTNYTKTIGALAATIMLTGGYAKAEFEGELSVGYTNMYEFRFVNLGRDLISSEADISFDLGQEWGLSAGAWYGSVNGAGVGNFDELDLYGAISKKFGPAEFKLGYIYYYFPGATGANTQEIYGSVSGDLGAGFGAEVIAYYDIQRFDGLYVNSELTYSVKLSECSSLDLAAGAAYGDGAGLQASYSGVVVGGNPGGTADGLQGWYLSASLPWTPRENLTITPFIKYTNADSDLLTDVNPFSTKSGQNYFIAGCSLTVAF